MTGKFWCICCMEKWQLDKTFNYRSSGLDLVKSMWTHCVRGRPTQAAVGGSIFFCCVCLPQSQSATEWTSGSTCATICGWCRAWPHPLWLLLLLLLAMAYWCWRCWPTRNDLKCCFALHLLPIEIWSAWESWNGLQVPPNAVCGQRP